MLNAARTVSQQLDSLASQDYNGEWELVVVDCGSSDGSEQVVLAHACQFRRFRFLRLDVTCRNRASAARNHGAASAAGELLAFCDADDVVTPNWLGALTRAAVTADLVGGRLDTESLNAQRVLAWHSPPAWVNGRSIHRFLPYASTANLAVWAEVFAALDGFGEDHPGAEDKDFAWRAQLAGYQLRHADEAVLAYRYRSGLLDTARQRYRWGVADARLCRDFRAHGMPHRTWPQAIGDLVCLIASVPAVVGSHSSRGRWVVRSAQLLGHLVGAARERVAIP
jgi:glycosyltransferase involved in cell wall biosynthesis